MTAITDQASADALRDIVREAVNEIAPNIIQLSHRIHAVPELAWEEHKSMAAVAAVMRGGGFTVTESPYGLPTAMEADHGNGELSVVICAEYDALPGVGHACGHNMIAAAGVGAALALKSVADAAGLRIKLLGTPAEEQGGGKVALMRAGAWENSTFSVMVHGTSGPDRGAVSLTSTAAERLEVVFKGRESHAAFAPDKGVNAAGAASLAIMNLAVLRQQLPQNASTNAFISHGGVATNIIAGETTIQLEVRAGDVDVWRELRRRVLACFEGAAIATGCSWTHRRLGNPYAPLKTHQGLGNAWDSNMEAIGRTVDRTPFFAGASTDMGNVSQVIPAAHGFISIRDSSAVPHHPDFTAAAITPEADEAVIEGATVMALTVLDAAIKPDLRAELLKLQKLRANGATTKDVLDA